MDRLEEMAKKGEKGGLFIPEDAREKNTPVASMGVVLAQGPEINPVYAEILQPGTGILFHPMSGDFYNVGKIEFIVLDVRDVKCTLEVTEGTFTLDEEIMRLVQEETTSS